MVADCPSPGNPSRKSSWKRGRQAGQLSRLHTEPCRWSSGSRWGAPPTEGPRLRDGALLGSQADSGRLHPSSGEPSPSVQDLSLPESHQTPRLWSLGQKDFRLRPHASLQGGTHGWCSCWVPPLDQTGPLLGPQGAGLQEGCCTYRQQVRIPGRETGDHREGKGVPNAPEPSGPEDRCSPNHQTAHEDQRPNRGKGLEPGTGRPRPAPGSRRRARPRPQVGAGGAEQQAQLVPRPRQVRRASQGKAGLGDTCGQHRPRCAPGG